MKATATTTGHEVTGHDCLRVHDWRAAQLRRLGVPGPAAEAAAGRVDWHEVANLVQRGCPPLLALRIVPDTGETDWLRPAHVHQPACGCPVRTETAPDCTCTAGHRVPRAEELVSWTFRQRLSIGWYRFCRAVSDMDYAIQRMAELRMRY